MPIAPFKLERFFALYEFKVKYLLSSSDCESLALSELLEMAAPVSRALWDDLRLGYTESPGHPLLRAEAARLYQTILPEQMIIAAPEEAIFIAMNTLLTSGDHVIAVSPAYQSLYEIARSLGCTLTPWRLRPTEDGWRLDIDELARSITEHTRLIVLNFPHNPTGHLLAPAELSAAIDLARRNGLYVFSDEMYRLLEYDPGARLPAVGDIYEKGISLSGLSKAFALPGLRIGWLATQEAGMVERWLTYKDYTTICNSAPSEILGIIALQNKDAILRRNLDIIRGNIDAAEKFFASHAGLFNFLPPRAGSIAFVEWLGSGTVEEFCQSLLDAQGVMITPGSLFDYPGNFFRLGLGRKNFLAALAQVEEYFA